MTAVAPQPEEDQNLKLLLSLRDSKPKVAIKLLKEGADVDFRDQTGCRPLHYAAKNGYIEVIELLLEKGAQTFAWDNNGQTALHKAAMQDQVKAIVILVARGAKIDIIDRTGRLPLEYAVRNKHVATVKLLCQFGTEPRLIDWTWLQDPDIKKKKDVMQIARVIKKQLMYISGYKHSAIRLDVAMISPGEGSIKLDNTGVEVTANEGQERFYLFLSQTEEAYSSPPPLGEEEEAFGHILECQTWGSKILSITLSVTVDRPVPKNEEVVLRPETPGGGIDHVEIQEVEGKEVTKVTLNVPLTSGMHQFAMATREKKQIVKVSNEAVVFKPEIEPEAEIDIPAGTFDSVELSIKFVDTAAVNEEIRDSEEAGESTEGQMLMTNVLDLTTSDDQQPNKDIKMKIPITAKDKSEEFVVMTSSDPDPNLDEWTWEILPAEIDDDGKAVFDIKHLSIFAGASKKSIDAEEKTVGAAIRQSYLKMRKIHFLVMVNKPQPNEDKTDVIIICGSPRKTKIAKKKLKRSYECFDSGRDLFEVPEGQCFQIKFHNGVKETSGDENLTVIFKSSDSVGQRHLEIKRTDPDLQDLSGKVEILSVSKYYPDIEEMREVGAMCWKSMEMVKVKSTDYETRTVSIVEIPFEMALVKKDSNEEEDEESTMDELERKDECIIPALKWKNLRDTMKEVSPDEALQLGLQLGLKQDMIDEIMEQSSQEDLAFDIIHKWRRKRPGAHQAEQLMHAFESIGKDQIVRRMARQGLEEQHEKDDTESYTED